MRSRFTLWRTVVASTIAVFLVVLSGVTAAAVVNYAFSVPVRHDFDFATDAKVDVTATTVKTNSTDVAVSESPDERLHVSVRGSYRGGDPEVSIGSGGSEVEVKCPDGKFWSCELSLFVQVPAELNVAVVGTNSNVELAGLGGDSTVATTVGSASVRNHTGALTVTTTVGDISVSGAEASAININTTKGSVSVDTAAASESMNIRSAFGDTGITMPSTVDYNIDARSANGVVRTDVVDNPTSPRRVIVASDHGDILIGPR